MNCAGVIEKVGFPMNRSFKAAIVGTLALAGVTVATADVQAMPIQSLNPAASSTSIEKVWWRGGYGWGWRRPYYGYGWGWRRPFYGYGWGWRRPFYGYGWRWRHPYYGWRRW